jgi:hypothetical protein
VFQEAQHLSIFQFRLIPHVRDKECGINAMLHNWSMFIGGDLGRRRRMHHIGSNRPTAAGGGPQRKSPRFHDVREENIRNGRQAG